MAFAHRGSFCSNNLKEKYFMDITKPQTRDITKPSVDLTTADSYQTNAPDPEPELPPNIAPFRDMSWHGWRNQNDEQMNAYRSVHVADHMKDALDEQAAWRPEPYTPKPY